MRSVKIIEEVYRMSNLQETPKPSPNRPNDLLLPNVEPSPVNEEKPVEISQGDDLQKQLHNGEEKVRQMEEEKELEQVTNQMQKMNISESPVLYSIGSKNWKPCAFHSTLSFLICDECRKKISDQGKHMRFQQNGNVQVCFSLCNSCGHAAVSK